jgi:hypothetical protein
LIFRFRLLRSTERRRSRNLRKGADAKDGKGVQAAGTGIVKAETAKAGKTETDKAVKADKTAVVRIGTVKAGKAGAIRFRRNK